MADKMRALYRGDRKLFLNGVPARNLTETDYQSLSDDQKKEVQESDLYEFRSDSEMSSSSAPRVTTRLPAAITGEPMTNGDTKPADSSA